MTMFTQEYCASFKLHNIKQQWRGSYNRQLRMGNITPRFKYYNQNMIIFLNSKISNVKILIQRQIFRLAGL